jgi:hypothetical protein
MQRWTTAAATALAIGFVVIFGGFALAIGIVGLLYLWPTFDPLSLQPHSYPSASSGFSHSWPRVFRLPGGRVSSGEIYT